MPIEYMYIRSFYVDLSDFITHSYSPQQKQDVK